jgi:signal transduction histidine kinase/ligand-binding sensor domain-containing protein
MWRAYLFIPLLWAGALHVHAQQEPLFDHLTTADGLPDPMVYALFEDRDGMLWAGTGAGLARLEGTRIRVFHHDRKDPHSLPHDQITDITASPSGTLWVATAGGLARFDRALARFTSWRIPGEGVEATRANRITDVHCVSDSLVWVVTDNGAYRFTPASGRFLRVDQGPAGSGPPGDRIAPHGLCWDVRRQGLGVATDRGMAFWESRSGQWTDHRNAPADATVFEPRRVSVPTLDAEGGLWCFDLDRLKLVHADPDRRIRTVIDRIGTDTLDFTPQVMAFDQRGDLWIATWTYRLLRLDPQGQWTRVKASIREPGRLPRTNVKAILESTFGDLWFGTSHGIGVLRPARQRMHVLRIGRTNAAITTILPWSRDTTLVGTTKDGVFLVDHRTGEHWSITQRPAPLHPDTLGWEGAITDLARRDARSAWVGTMSDPQVLDMNESVLRPARELATPALFQRALNISFLRPEGDSLLWVGTWRDGLFLIAPGKGQLRHFTSGSGVDALPDKGVLCWATTRNGSRYIGMNDGGGLARVYPDRVEPLRTGNSDRTGGVVRCITEAPDGRLWVGTHEEGIEVVDLSAGTTTYLTRQDGLPSDRVLSIVFDGQGGIWATTDHGPAYKPPGSPGFHAIALPAGLDPLRTYGTLVRMVDDRIAFAVGEHLVTMDPDPRSMAERRPRAVFTTVITNDSSQFSPPQGHTLTLHHDAKALTVEVGAIGMAPRERPIFRYRISDMDSTWSLAGQAERINLYDLPTGSHRIELQASTNGVEWSPDPAVLNVNVLPAFWATWWFQLLAFVTLVAGLYFGFRSYVRQRLRQERERHAREQAVLTERVRIAGDMHDDLGAGLSALKLKSEMALRVEKDPEKREQLSGLASTAGELIGSMRQIIWTMNDDQTGLEDLVVYTTSYARTYAGQQALTITVKADGPWPAIALSTVQRRNVFLVVKEALHNIVKHAQARQVTLGLAWTGALVVDLHDDGIGLAQGGDQAAGSGLRNMLRRVTDLHGMLDVASGPAGIGGTVIRFSIPLPPNDRSIAPHHER